MKKQIILPLIALLLCGCDDEKPSETRFIGSWRLTAMEVDGASQTLQPNHVDSILIFLQPGIMEIEGVSGKIRSGWNYQDEILYISKHLPACYYVETLNENTLKMMRQDFNDNGHVTHTTTTFTKQ